VRKKWAPRGAFFLLDKGENICYNGGEVVVVNRRESKMAELRLRFLSRPGVEFKNDPANGGIEKALETLRHLDSHGALRLQENNVSDEELGEVYFGEVVRLSVRKKIGLRRVFGSARQSGVAYFGKEVPALLVFQGDRLVNVYPHREKGREITISNYVATLPVPLV